MCAERCAWKEESMADKKSQGLLSKLFKHDDKEAGSIFQTVMKDTMYGWMQSQLRTNTTRGGKYADYEAMNEDSIIQTALEVYVDEALQYSRQQGAELWVTGTKKADVNTAADFLSAQEMHMVREWCKWMCLYGDFFIRVQGQAGKGITTIAGIVHPSEVERLEWNGYLYGFRLQGEKEVLKPWELIHFRLLGGSGGKIKTVTGKSIKDSDKIIYDTAIYGSSVLDPARRTYKQLTLIEDHIIVGRLSRATLTYLISIMTGNLQVEESLKLTKLVEERLKEKISMNSSSFDAMSNYKREGDIAVFPVAGEKGSMQVQEMGGDPNVTGVQDLDHLIAKISGALKIPAAFLGFTKDLPGSFGEGPLREMAKRFSRTVKRIQSSLITGLMQLISIHFAYLGQDITGTDLQVEMLDPSGVEDQERRESLESAMRTMTELLVFLEQLGLKEEVDRKKLAHMVLSDMSSLGFDIDDILVSSDKTKEIPKTPKKERVKVKWPFAKFDELRQLVNKTVRIMEEIS